MKKKTIKNNKLKTPKLSKKLPNKLQCNAFNKYHLPWKSKQYKKKCEEIGCIHKKGFLGSYCYDRITLTNINIEKNLLNSNIYISTLTESKLLSILKECNVANQTYLNKINKLYLNNRLKAIKNIVVDVDENLLMKITDIDLNKVIQNAKKLNLKNIKSFQELQTIKFLCHERLFTTNYGNKPSNYKDLRWNVFINELHQYGIYHNSYFYNLGKKHFLIYSCNSPYYISNLENNNCENDCDCNGINECSLGECKEPIFSELKNIRKKNINELPLPKGNWIESARNYYIKDNILFAELKNRNGIYILNSCYFDNNDTFQNINGRFQLVYSRKLPKGSWILKTRNYYIKYNLLFGELKNNKGKYKLQYIEITNKNIMVNNGKFFYL